MFYLIADERTGQKLLINEKQYQHMLANAKKIEEKLGSGVKVMPTAARLTRKNYKRAFLGSELLQSGDAPIKGRYSWACITGELDREKGHWFGLIKIMRDPQMWANKWWLSKTLHFLNTTAKGGIVADKHTQPKWSSTMKRSRRKELEERAIYRDRLDEEHTRKWLRDHAPHPEPARNPKPLPLERWEIRLRAQKQQRRALTKPLLKGGDR